MENDIKQKLEDLDDGQHEILRRVKLMDKRVRDVIIEIGGVPDEIGRDPDRPSLRRRVHRLETADVASKTAAAALEAASQLRAAANENRFTKREKIAGLLLALLVAIGPFIAPLFYHH